MCTYTNLFISFSFVRIALMLYARLTSFTYTGTQAFNNAHPFVSFSRWCAIVFVCAYTKHDYMLKPRFSLVAPFVSLFPIAHHNAISVACVFWIIFVIRCTHLRANATHTRALCVCACVGSFNSCFSRRHRRARQRERAVCARLWIIIQA